MNLVHSFVLTHALIIFFLLKKIAVETFPWKYSFHTIPDFRQGVPSLFFGWHTCLKIVPNHSQPTNRPNTKENRNVWDFLKKKLILAPKPKILGKNFQPWNSKHLWKHVCMQAARDVGFEYITGSVFERDQGQSPGHGRNTLESWCQGGCLHSDLCKHR